MFTLQNMSEFVIFRFILFIIVILNEGFVHFNIQHISVLLIYLQVASTMTQCI